MDSHVSTTAGRDWIASAGDLLRLRAALFVAGAAVMVLQIVGTRIIGPLFGAGLSGCAALITILLVAPAARAFLGGILADRHPPPRSVDGIRRGSAMPLLRPPTHRTRLVPRHPRWGPPCRHDLVCWGARAARHGVAVRRPPRCPGRERHGPVGWVGVASRDDDGRGCS